MVKWQIKRINNTYIVSKKDTPQWRILLAQGYGKDTEDHIILSPIEVAYLVMENKAYCQDELQEIISFGTKNDPLFLYYLIVYVDLRKRKYLVKIAHQNGTILFEVYPPNTDVITTSPKYIVYVIQSERSIAIKELDRIIRYAKEQNKKLTLAIVDQDGDLVYYDVDTTLRYKVTLKLRRDFVIP